MYHFGPELRPSTLWPVSVSKFGRTTPIGNSEDHYVPRLHFVVSKPAIDPVEFQTARFLHQNYQFRVLISNTFWHIFPSPSSNRFRISFSTSGCQSFSLLIGCFFHFWLVADNFLSSYGLLVSLRLCINTVIHSPFVDCLFFCNLQYNFCLIVSLLSLFVQLSLCPHC
jgi:hypothetical protein